MFFSVSFVSSVSLLCSTNKLIIIVSVALVVVAVVDVVAVVIVVVVVVIPLAISNQGTSTIRLFYVLY
jgi:hypothetical protein